MRGVVVVSLALLAYGVPSTAREQENLHDRFRQAVQLWIAGKEDQALDLVDGTSEIHDDNPDDRAALLDLGARILQVRAHSLFGEKRKETLQRAEYRAAQAVSGRPMNIAFWRDYIRIAEERVGGGELLRRLDTGIPWSYENFGPQAVTLHDDEQRAIARAVFDTSQGRDSSAVEALEEFVARSNLEACSARIILSELEFRLDRMDAARKALSSRGKDCLALPIVLALTARMRGAETAKPSDDLVLVRSVAQDPAASQYEGSIEVKASEVDVSELENNLLRDSDDLELWHALWRRIMRPTDPREREWNQVVSLSGKISTASRGPVAAMYNDLGRGRFKRALKSAVSSLKQHSDDPQLHSCRLLAGAAVGEDTAGEFRTSIDMVWNATPRMAACLARVELERCLTGSDQCSLGAIVCRNPDEFVLQAFEQGWQTIKGQLKKYFDRRIDLEHFDRIAESSRLRTEIAENNRTQSERLDALNRRIDLAVMPRLEALDTEVGGVKSTQEEMAISQEKERQRTRAKIEELARDMSHQFAVQRADLSMTQQELQLLSMRLAADRVVIDGMPVDRLPPAMSEFIEKHDAEFEKFKNEVLEEIERLRSGNDLFPTLGDIRDDCRPTPGPGGPCLRSILKLVKKYVAVQWTPPSPPTVSFDLLAIEDSVIELIDLATHAASKPQSK